MTRRPSICFVAPLAYPVLADDRTVKFVGGAEVQQCTLAREFVRRGWDVSMICLDTGQPDGVIVDGIKVHNMHAPKAGLPVVRFVHPRFTSVWRAMKRADADIYYQRTAGALTAFVVAFARRHGRTSMYACASDRDVLPDLPNVKIWRDKQLFRWGVRNADLVVAQSDRQVTLCEQTYQRAPLLIQSCYGHAGRAGHPAGPVIWVANLLPVKRPELFVELARRLPHTRFKLIGGSDHRRLDALKALATDVPNLVFTGHVPYADVEQHFDGASMLVNTSVHEGFPNTYMQSWSRGIPTVSFFDPQVLHGNTPVGVVATSLDDMCDRVRELLEQPDRWKRQSDMSRTYFNANFSVGSAVDHYEAALRPRVGAAPKRVSRLS